MNTRHAIPHAPLSLSRRESNRPNCVAEGSPCGDQDSSQVLVLDAHTSRLKCKPSMPVFTLILYRVPFKGSLLLSPFYHTQIISLVVLTSYLLSGCIDIAVDHSTRTKLNYHCSDPLPSFTPFPVTCHQHVAAIPSSKSPFSRSARRRPSIPNHRTHRPHHLPILLHPHICLDLPRPSSSSYLRLCYPPLSTPRYHPQRP